MHYYKFNIGDWGLSTSHLSLEEEAIYFRLINYYYDTEQPIPVVTHSVFRRLRMASQTETAEYILAEYFVKTDKGWIHSRCEKDLKDYRKTAKKNRVNGAKGGRPSKHAAPSITQTKPSGLPNASQNNPNQEPLTTNQEPLTKESAALPKETMPALLKFDMSDAWIPEQITWDGNRFKAGCDNYSPEALHEFQMYWSGEDKIFTESQWQMKLITSLKRQKSKTNPFDDPEERERLITGDKRSNWAEGLDLSGIIQERQNENTQ